MKPTTASNGTRLALVALCLAQPAADAANITWEPATDATLNGTSTAFVETDVLNNGTHVAAVTNGIGGTLNGVTFQAWTAFTDNRYITYGDSPISMAWAPDAGRNQNGWGSPTNAYGHFGYDNGTAANLLLTGGGEGDSPGTITLGALTAGREYQVQLWAPSWDQTFSTKIEGFTLRIARPPAFVPQYVVGTFTADGTAQTITWSGIAPVAVSLRDLTSGGTMVLTITQTDPGFLLAWTSQAGMLYNVRSSADLTTAVSSWALVAGDIAATPDTNTYSVNPTETRLFYVVEEFPAPPPPALFSEDFESGDGGFTVVTKGGTAWAYGTPNSPDQGGGAVTAGNGGSAKCWGTNIGDPGGYLVGTDTSLRSPVIDLTGVADATLSFAEALDIALGHSLVVNVIEAASDTVIQPAVHTSTPDPNISKADWQTVPAIAITGGQPMRIEWRFTSDGTGDGTYLGAYIDDIIVTAPGS